jgi:hypothetical protein
MVQVYIYALAGTAVQDESNLLWLALLSGRFTFKQAAAPHILCGGY